MAAVTEMTDPTNDEVIIWREAMERALDCVPYELQGEVLRRLVAKIDSDAKAPRFKPVSIAELMQPRDSDGLWNPIARASSVMVQTLVRFITNNHSRERGAAILFREHRAPGFRGSGSGFLPDYLDGLPGITVDRDECIKIAVAEAAGKAI